MNKTCSLLLFCVFSRSIYLLSVNNNFHFRSQFPNYFNWIAFSAAEESFRELVAYIRRPRCPIPKAVQGNLFPFISFVHRRLSFIEVFAPNHQFALSHVNRLLIGTFLGHGVHSG